MEGPETPAAGQTVDEHTVSAKIHDQRKNLLEKFEKRYGFSPSGGFPLKPPLFLSFLPPVSTGEGRSTPGWSIRMLPTKWGFPSRSRLPLA